MDICKILINVEFHHTYNIYNLFSADAYEKASLYTI